MTQTVSGRITPDKACEALGITKTPYYDRLKFLNLQANKDDEGVYLTKEQMKLMEDLNEHIKKTGKMEGFQGGGQLALSESSGLASASALEVPEMEAETFAQIDDERLSQLIEEAGELKVQQVAMPELIRLHLAAGMTEDDLSNEQRAKLRAIREAATPKSNAAASLAQKMLQRHRQNQRNEETK